MEGEGLKCTVHVWCLPCHPRHLMLLSPPTPLNIFYKCAKLRGLCQKSSVTGTSINQVGNTLQPWSYVIDLRGSQHTCPPMAHRQAWAQTVVCCCCCFNCFLIPPAPPFPPCPA